VDVRHAPFCHGRGLAEALARFSRKVGVDDAASEELRSPLAAMAQEQREFADRPARAAV